MPLPVRGRDSMTIRIAQKALAFAITSVLFVGTSFAYAQETPALSTDKADYFPGETATIYGSFFQALQDVVLAIVGQDDSGNTIVTSSWNVIADDFGAFTTAYALPDTYVPLYLLAANSTTGELLASTSFTDSISLSSVTVGSQTGTLTVGTAGAVTYGICVAYNGNNSVITYSVTSALPSGVTASFSPNGIQNPAKCPTNSSTLTLTATAAASAGSYPFTVQATGGGTVSSGGTLVIQSIVAKTDPTVSIVNSPQTYTGSPLAATVSGSVAGIVSDIKYGGSSAVPTAAGSYAVTVDFAPTDTVNYNSLNDASAGTFTIDPAGSVTTVTCGAGPFTYTGSAQTPCSASVTGAGGLNQALTVSYSDNIDVGFATASATFAGDANHTGSDDSENFTIGQADSVTVVSCPATAVYTGSPLTPCTVSVTGAGGLNLTLAASYADNVVAGTASADYTFAGDTNHTGSSDSENFDIIPASSVTTVTCAPSVTYTGAALTPCVVSVTGAGGLNLVPDADYTDNVDAGTGHASYTFGGDINHTGSTDSADFTINPAGSVVVVSCPTSVEYAASAQEPCTAEVTGVGGLSEALAVFYTDNTDAGTAHASASYAGDANHTGSDDAATFEITPADAACYVTGYAVLYNGSAHTASGYCEDLLGNPLTTLDLSGTTHTAGGAYSDTWYFNSDDTNYADGSGMVNDVIIATQPPITITKKEFQKGSTIPVKVPSTIDGWNVRLFVCDAGGGTCTNANVHASGGSNFENQFRFDASGAKYIYNLSTKLTPIFTTAKSYDLWITVEGIVDTPFKLATIQIR